MASAVAGAMKWIGSVLIEEGKYLYGVEDLIRSLQKDLKYMHMFLQKVESNPNPVRDDDALHILTEEMRELAIRAEDAVSIYRVDVESKLNSTNFFFKFSCLAFHSYPVHVLRMEIEAIQKEIEQAMKRSGTFSKNLRNLESQHKSDNIGSSSSRHNPENFLHLDEFVVGIEEDTNDLVMRLINPEDDFRVLGIVGTGGAGKSTLATKIYRHDEVQSWFSIKAFVSVSQQWDNIDLLSRIYKQIMSGTDNTTPPDKNVLLKTLHDFMKDKRCLVVLDDIWDKKAYNAIRPIFPLTNGIRVIITTRNEEVILHADTKSVSYMPKMLTDEEKLDLFRNIAMEGREDIEHDIQFLNLGQKMLEKIEGLPLAVVTLAGILRTKQHLYEWKRISEACSRNILKEDEGLKYGSVKEMLGLSYLDLPSHLKPCFLYLGIIPEDEEFACQQIAQMWIAEGFITDELQMGEESLEDVAMQVLGELAQRCILQITRRDFFGQAISFRMHDLMREFCIEMANQYDFLKVVTTTHPDAKARRLSICSRDYDPEENQHLRTLVYNYGRQYNQEKEEIKNLESIHKQFKLLRVLRIDSSPWISSSLPKQIGDLIYLTYLSLIDTEIRTLPKSIRNLRNLLYFEYTTSPGIAVNIPNNLLGNMENLRTVELPKWLENFETLGLSSELHKKLHTFKCGGGTWMKKELPDLSSTVLNLEICSTIENVEEIEAVYQYLSSNLCTLSLRIDRRLQFDLEEFSHCQKLWRLEFEGPAANVVSFQFPPNLEYLDLSDTRIREGVDLMEVLGQLSVLKYLRLSSDAYIGKKLSCASSTAFPELEELNLWFMGDLEEWEMERGAMKVLRKIQINNCWELKKLPECIRYIDTLEELEATGMSEEFCCRLGYGDEEAGARYEDDSEIIANIPFVTVYSI